MRAWYRAGMKAGLEREVKLRPGPGLRRVELEGRPIADRTLTVYCGPPFRAMKAWPSSSKRTTMTCPAWLGLASP